MIFTHVKYQFMLQLYVFMMAVYHFLFDRFGMFYYEIDLAFIRKSAFFMYTQYSISMGNT